MQIILIYGINLRKTSVKQLHLSRTVNANSWHTIFSRCWQFKSRMGSFWTTDIMVDF
jgi:hypothetical protein